MQTQTFQILQDKRKRWVEVNKENKFDEGINRLLTELYPDNAHFIYELLQNAEDARATEVSFALENEGVWFEHNGRSFELKDIDAITSIGNSTKRDDPTTIGKFGVGFKAVFAYTASPFVHSDEYSFKISDLVIPSEVESNRKSKSTGFYFPFNHHLKSQSDAYQEISAGLNGLHDNALLFLKSISKLTYSIGKDTYSIERKFIDDNKIEIVRTANKQEKSTHWLRFDQEINHKKEDGITLNLYVSLAFALEEKLVKEQEQWSIMPVDGQVSIFFPAEKETSNLKFHIHAPFESTVARDSIRDTATNKMLRDKLVNLFVASMSEIKKRGFLTRYFLSVLPNKNDNLSDYYKPFMDEVINSFNNNPLLPMKNKKYQYASKAYVASSKITDVINDALLAKLKQLDDDTLWTVGAQVSTREYYFLESLDITEYDYDDFYSDLNDEENNNIFNEFIGRLSDKSILIFYSLLNYIFEQTRYSCISCDNLILLKCQDGSFHSGSDDDRVYLLRKGQLEESNENILIDIDIEKYTFFLKSFNIVILDKAQKLLDTLDGYDACVAQPLPKHIDIVVDLEKVFDDLNRDQKNIVMKSKFLLAKSPSGKLLWCSPKELYIDYPYVDTKLACCFDVLSEVYHEHTFLSDFFISSLKLKTNIEIERKRIQRHGKIWKEIRGYENATDYEESVDWDISKREEMCAASPESASFIIWNTLINYSGHYPSVLEASYAAHTRAPTRRTKSTLCDFLINSAWIEANDGQFYKPKDMSEQLLPQGYRYDPNHFILKAIGFGAKHQQSQAEHTRKNEQARALGFESTDEVRKIKEMIVRCGGVESMEKLLAEKADNPANEAGKHQGRVVKDPDRREKRLLQRNTRLSKKEIDLRVRSISLGTAGSTREAKAFLVNTYTSDSRLLCQCCDQVMPFKVNGQYYFEAVDCVKDLDKRYQENKLALCPTCAAMYKHANDEQNAIEGKILGIKFDASHDAVINLPVKLASKQCKITFAAVHLHDLKATLEDLC
jgi:hypothetical protein